MVLNTYLLLSFLQVEKHELVVREATFGESEADTVGVGRAARPIESESWHFGLVQKFRHESGAVRECEELRHVQATLWEKIKGRWRGSGWVYKRKGIAPVAGMWSHGMVVLWYKRG